MVRKERVYATIRPAAGGGWKWVCVVRSRSCSTAQGQNSWVARLVHVTVGAVGSVGVVCCGLVDGKGVSVCRRRRGLVDGAIRLVVALEPGVTLEHPRLSLPLARLFPRTNLDVGSSLECVWKSS